MKNTQETNYKQADFSGQVRTVLVSTENAAASYEIKEIDSDRTGAALRKVVPPTPLSECSRKRN